MSWTLHIYPAHVTGLRPGPTADDLIEDGDVPDARRVPTAEAAIEAEGNKEHVAHGAELRRAQAADALIDAGSI